MNSRRCAIPGLSTPKNTDPLDFVQSPAGDRQYCVKTIMDVDKELRVLRRRIETANKFPDLVKAFREDIDLLLDRRSYLVLTATTGREPA
jgi:hypothetical protein